MEVHEMLGYMVDGLYVNRKRIEERDGKENPQYRQVNEKYIRMRNLFIKEHQKYIAQYKQRQK